MPPPPGGLDIQLMNPGLDCANLTRGAKGFRLSICLSLGEPNPINYCTDTVQLAYQQTCADVIAKYFYATGMSPVLAFFSVNPGIDCNSVQNPGIVGVSIGGQGTEICVRKEGAGALRCGRYREGWHQGSSAMIAKPCSPGTLVEWRQTGARATLLKFPARQLFALKSSVSHFRPQQGGADFRAL